MVVVVALLLVGLEIDARRTAITSTAGGLDRQRSQLASAEGEIDGLEREIADAAEQLAGLDERIGAIERRHRAGIPRAVRQDYETLIATRNDVATLHDALVGRHRALTADYARSVDRHNADVDDANRQAAGLSPLAVARDLWNDLLGPWTADD